MNKILELVGVIVLFVTVIGISSYIIYNGMVLLIMYFYNSQNVVSMF